MPPDGGKRVVLSGKGDEEELSDGLSGPEERCCLARLSLRRCLKLLSLESVGSVHVQRPESCRWRAIRLGVPLTSETGLVGVLLLSLIHI